MRIIEIDGKNCKTLLDFYDMLLAALGAPARHGRNVNALLDSMVWGGMNAVEPPYTVRIRGTSNLPKEIHSEIEILKKGLDLARADFLNRQGHEVEVYLETDC